VTRSTSIDIEDPEEVTIESNPQLYPSIIKRGNKLELKACGSSNDDRCPLDKLMNLLIDVWGMGQLTVKTVYNFGIE
jgi:hypothetical protein